MRVLVVLFDVCVVFVVVDDATVAVIDVVFMGFSAGEREVLFQCVVCIFHRYFPFREREQFGWLLWAAGF